MAAKDLGRYSRKMTGGNPGFPAGTKNGRVPLSLLRRCKTQTHLGQSSSRYLWPEASLGFDAMHEAARKDHIKLRLVVGYRTLSKQVEMRKYWAGQGKPSYAAIPGTSNHGLGVAVDIDRHSRDTAGIVNWLQKHAIYYGFDHPIWAGDGKGVEEPWHWQAIKGWTMSTEPAREPIIIGDMMELAKGYVEQGVSWAWVRQVTEEFPAIRIVIADGVHCVLERDGYGAKTFAESQGIYRHENGEGYVPLGELEALGYAPRYGTAITMRDLGEK